MEPNNRNNRNRGDKNRRRGGGMWSIVLWALLLTIGVNYLSVMLDQARTAESSCEIAYSELVELVEEGKVKSIEFGDTVFTITPVDGFTYTDDDGKRYDQNYTLFTTIIPDATENLITLCDEHGVTYTKPYQPPVSPILTFMVSYILPTVLMVGAFMLLMNFITKKSGGMGGIGGIGNAGKANAKVYMEKSTGVTFADVAGQDEAKESLVEIIDFLHNPEKYTAIGAKIPKGALLVGSPGTGKTTVLKTILEVHRRLYPDGQIVLMAPTGRASRRMAESTGFDMARTLHSGLGLGSEEDDVNRTKQQEPLSADLIIVDEFSMVDMWLADKFFSRIKDGARIVLVGDPDQLPSVGAGNVFRELIDCELVPVTVLDQIFRQSKDSLIAYNAKFINEGNTKLYYGPDFMFMASDNQADAAERIISRYCREIEESGIDRVQILSPFRSEGAASAEQLNEAIREVVNPFRSAEDEIKIGVKVFRVNDRIMQTKNTAKVSNGDLGFIRYIKDGENGKRVGLDFGVGRELEYSVEDMVNLDLAYATTIHKSMGSEYETVIMPLLKAHSIMLYRNLLYTGITRAKKRVVLIGQKQVLFMAIHRNEISKRNTLLGARIDMYFKAYARRAGIPLPNEAKKELKHAG